jgi:hypothetical protein
LAVPELRLVYSRLVLAWAVRTLIRLKHLPLVPVLKLRVNLKAKKMHLQFKNLFKINLRRNNF